MEDFDYSDMPEEFENTNYYEKESNNFLRTKYGHNFTMMDSPETKLPTPYYGISQTRDLVEKPKNKIKLGDLFNEAEKITYLKRDTTWRVEDQKYNPVKSLLIFYCDNRFPNSSYLKILQNLKEFLPDNWKLVVIPISGDSHFEMIKLD